MLYALALELVALLGFLSLLFNVLLPALELALRFVAVDVPCEWHKWRLYRAQQCQLQRLQCRADALNRRSKRKSRKHNA
ncbi:RxLR-like protein [Plasmopara halstedii]|uniref:RxLR-like protein n=1 Tax=Plasmopara halstedii TaxID=4781 RepID=A0A0P1B6Y0_PLAHL|nr:RxLR-like protein [Plasmopara halstedii]CEG50078.1 RxLR-like protein [Plasmopara halstedii]|eukprot:XP_024586447.1 RxLR-like protein [Plasmopara halstedii]